MQWGREFRYDDARQRYLNAVLDPDDLENGVVTRVSSVWSDYDGDEVYGDFTVTPASPPTVTNVQSFELGVGKFSWGGGVPSAATRQYYHTDMIGTTRFMSNSAGNQVDPAVYTAFGERISGTNHRYGYAGAYGYQAQDEFPFLHVGHRYYDSATGRFLQRDPIGILGGRNVYAYTGNAPTYRVDPSGLDNPLWGYPRPYPPPPKEPATQTPEQMQEELDALTRRIHGVAAACAVLAAFTYPIPPLSAGLGGGAAAIEGIFAAWP